ncbi:DUF427-domain-containing protein [Mollisia scopiformis]|uniref:DUF427-domain-containing protein n=1 Tax=Mollisia scopiformis TaxID=149040 RepID=A0A194X0B6_MOLSC|nr:DUF427-domain-containing protein [Mollisia scopiformis]KUJ13312.1 DUF427-domain-containing protein [Mollisia scopiformis]
MPFPVFPSKILTSNISSLIPLAQKLSKNGPVKRESTPRRIRGLFAGEWVFDTLGAVYVWEDVYYPYFYIPVNEFREGVLEKVEGKGEGEDGFYLARLRVGDRSTERVIVFSSTSVEAVRGLVRVEHSTIDWFAEDEKLLGPHPKDPYKRIETLPSSRRVRIEVAGVVVAESSQNVFLYETMLRPRYYLNAGDVKWEFLSESGTISYCPYKGMATYYNVKVKGREIKDAVWYYRYPTSESALVAGRLCFYNEKVDVFVDGVREESPRLFNIPFVQKGML